MPTGHIGHRSSDRSQLSGLFSADRSAFRLPSSRVLDFRSKDYRYPSPLAKALNVSFRASVSLAPINELRMFSGHPPLLGYPSIPGGVSGGVLLRLHEVAVLRVSRFFTAGFLLSHVSKTFRKLNWHRLNLDPPGGDRGPSKRAGRTLGPLTRFPLRGGILLSFLIRLSTKNFNFFSFFSKQ